MLYDAFSLWETIRRYYRHQSGQPARPHSAGCARIMPSSQAFCFLPCWSLSGNPAFFHRFVRQPLSLGEYDATVTEQSGTPWSEVWCDMSCRYLWIHIGGYYSCPLMPPKIKKLSRGVSWGTKNFKTTLIRRLFRYSFHLSGQFSPAPQTAP